MAKALLHAMRAYARLDTPGQLRLIAFGFTGDKQAGILAFG
jgi:hypothetical protein